MTAPEDVEPPARPAQEGAEAEPRGVLLIGPVMRAGNLARYAQAAGRMMANPMTAALYRQLGDQEALAQQREARREADQLAIAGLAHLREHYDEVGRVIREQFGPAFEGLTAALRHLIPVLGVDGLLAAIRAAKPTWTAEQIQGRALLARHRQRRGR